MRKFSSTLVRILNAEQPFKTFLLFFLLFSFGASSFAQQRQLHNPDVIIGKLIKVIPSLKDYKAPQGYHDRITRDRNGLIGVKEELEGPELTYYGSKDKGDPVVQRTFPNSQNRQAERSPNPGPNIASAILQNFDGMGIGGITPADPNMCAGPTAVIQTTNAGGGGVIRIWNLSGTQILAQTTISTLVGGSGYSGQGDPVVVYDPLADRYLVNEFGNIGGGNPNTMVMMVSQTNNPLGGWFIYKFQVAFFPDYPKWSAWPNAYYASTNDFNSSGAGYIGSSVWAFNKAKMLAGDATAEAQRFRIFTGSNGSTGSMPVTVSGGSPAPPAGSAGMFMYFNDNDFTADPNDADSIGIVTFQPNFAVPASTVLTFAQAMATAPFLSGVGGAPSPGSGTYGTLSDRLMFCANYRNFGATESIVLDHTVDASFGVGGAVKSGVRWYELTRSGANWSISQQSTYAPDADWRFLGSININSKHQIALGFNLSSTTKFGSILFTGRNATDPPNNMGVQEQLIKAGNAYGTFSNRWGDYNSMSVDMVNDSLFWTTAMYGNTASSWGTRLCQFRIGDCDVLRSDFSSFTQNAPAVPESQNIVYTNTVSNTGCINITNYLLTDTLPANVTFVSATNGGTYNAGNRVVSWPVNLNPGISQNYTFTVNINSGTYFAPVTLFNDPVTGATIPPAIWSTSSTTANVWASSTVRSHSVPNSYFSVNTPVISDQRLFSTNAIALPAVPGNLTFWHYFSTEPTYDGGILEISTNGGTTYNQVLNSGITTGGYTNVMDASTVLAGRLAWSGASGGWVKVTVPMAPYANQSVKLRFRSTTDNGTNGEGWYVDDIDISNIAHVDMRSSLFNGAGVRQFYKDTITLILPPSGCTGQTVTSQPSNVTTCNGTAASFSVTAAGTAPITYQWQESTNGGGTWNPITNGGIYSGATTQTLNISAVTLAMNGYQYRAVVSGCTANVNSNPATLTVVLLSVGGTVSPANTSICGTTNTGTLTLSGHTGSVIGWEFSTVSAAGPFNPVVPTNTTTTLTYNNLPVTTYFRAVVQAPGCAPANSSVATVTIIPGGLPMSIVADPGTTVCAGDPTRLTAQDGGLAPTTNVMTQNPTTFNAIITLNFRNNNAFAVTLTDISGMCNLPGATNVSAYYKAAAINGNPGLINTANGWNQFGSATINSAGFPNVQPFMSGLNLVVPAGATYGIVVSAVTTGGTSNIVYSNAATTLISSAGGCDMITGANIGYAGGQIPAGAYNTPRYFIGSFTYSAAGTPITTGTFLWSPAAGLSSTTTNPVAASPAVTTTYTVRHDNGAGCTRVASITITVNQRPVVTTQPSNVSLCSSLSASFSVTATGTGITYQWQESTNGGVSYANVPNAAPYFGSTTPTLTINPVTVAMSGNRYRVVVSGTCSPGLGNPNISSGAILTVVASPTVTVTPTVSCGGPGNCNPLTASGANTYTWSPAAGLYLDCALAIPYVAGSNAATVYAAPLVNTIYTVTGTSTATGCSSTATATVNYTPAKPIVSPTSATMCLGDAAVPLTITSSLAPTTQTFTNNVGTGLIPDGPPFPPAPGTIFPATTTTIPVAIPVGGVISSMSVKLNITHTYVSDLVIVLKAPNGNVLNLSAAVSTTGKPGANFVNTVISSTGVAALSTGTVPGYTGTFKPDAAGATFVTSGATIPGGPNSPAGYIPNVNSFNGLYSVPNGVWTLALYDYGQGDQGNVNNWSIDVTYGVPSGGIWTPNGVGSGLFTDAGATTVYNGAVAQTVYAKPAASTTYSVTVSTGNCSSAPTLVPVTVNVPVNITAQPVNATVCTDKVATFSVTATGTSPAYQWQVSTNGGVTFTAVTNGGVYSGATTNTLTITAPPVTMNGYQYRVAVAGQLPCPTIFSAARTLTVNPLPTVVITASLYQNLFPGLTTTLSSTSTPAAVTYTWFRNGIVVPGATTGSYIVDIDHLGDYTLRVVDVNGCVNTSNMVPIHDSLSGRVFIYPNPNSGSFQVRYNPVHNNVTPYGINILDAMGKRILNQPYTLGTAYAPMYVNLGNYSSGVYWVEVVDVDGQRLAMGRVEILR